MQVIKPNTTACYVLEILHMNPDGATSNNISAALECDYNCSGEWGRHVIRSLRDKGLITKTGRLHPWNLTTEGKVQLYWSSPEIYSQPR